MFTTGSKWFLGLGLVSLVLAAAYGWTTGGTRLGPVTLGYYGGVGEHLGYALLISTGVAAVLLGLVAVAARDADASALASYAGTDEAPAATAPAHRAYWPILGAVGASAVVLGLVISNAMFIGGLIVLLVVLVEWMVTAWADRATGDPAVNFDIRRRIMAPYEVPVLGSAGAGIMIFACSRLFLTASKLGAVWVATGIGAVIFIVGLLIASRPKLSANVIAGVLLLAGVGAGAAGIAAAARGERTIEPHHTEHVEDEHPEEPGVLPEDGGEAEADAGTGLRPNVPEGTQRATTTTTEAEG
jgi:hypothetical protein